jgi:hypothetical protein
MSVSLRVDDRQFRVRDGMTLTAALLQGVCARRERERSSGAPRGHPNMAPASDS